LEDFLLEEESQISFHSEDTDFQLESPEKLVQWIKEVIAWRAAELHQLTYVFCSDDYLYKMNVEYLAHDTLTDIITFPYQEPPQIEGDIFISVDRVRDNARVFKVPFEQELRRVIIHGVLHLSGQGDKTEAEAAEMRRLEEEAIALYP
jgi:rRNA maturation RNase YbeY